MQAVEVERKLGVFDGLCGWDWTGRRKGESRGLGAPCNTAKANGWGPGTGEKGPIPLVGPTRCVCPNSPSLQQAERGPCRKSTYRSSYIIEGEHERVLSSQNGRVWFTFFKEITNLCLFSGGWGEPVICVLFDLWSQRSGSSHHFCKGSKQLENSIAGAFLFS